ncbi:MAG: EAL domain-containing protein [Pseudomonadales bacterium]|nr:EAL domain-containing protein [Pseudomonadales bacterium]
MSGTSILNYVQADQRTEFTRLFKDSYSTSDRISELKSLLVLGSATVSNTGTDSGSTAAGATASPPRSGTAARTLDARLVHPASHDGVMLVAQDLSEHNASLDQLRASEARFSRIFHTSPDAILILRHKDSLVLDFNAGFTRLLGYTREDAIGYLEMDLRLFFDPLVRQQTVQHLLDAGEHNDLEVRLRRKDGEPVTVEISIRYIEIDGELCVLCIGRDISKRTLAEAALRESEEKFEQVFLRSPDGIIILKQQDLSIYDINTAFVDASGYSREALLGKSILELDAFFDPNELKEASRELAEQGTFSNREMRLKTRDGSSIRALVSATLVDINDSPCVLCVTKDINELRSAEEKLRQSEQRFRGAFENAPIGILLVDNEGRIFQANNFAAEMLGFEDLSLDNMHISRLIPSEDRSQFKETLQRLMTGKDDTLRVERRLLRNDSLEIWTNLHVVVQRDNDGTPQYLIVQLADISEMKLSQRRMERMAFYDTLTDLANRRLFFDRLSQVIEHTQRGNHLAGLLYLDLDQFKRVNDTLGHEIGDVLLQEVASRLSRCVRKEDTVGRPGGDEFTVLLSDIRTPSDASLVAEKILKALRQPLNISGHQLVITPSIGIAIIPDDGRDPNALMKNADLAMYRAKEHGRNNFQFYSEEMNTNAVKRLRTEYELRRALDRQEFELFYQPKVRLSDQRIVGVECLIRWHHPDRGLLSPVEFIDIAEETGAIVDMGNWIITEACRTGKLLSDQQGAELEIAINMSPRQFKDPNLVANIRRALRESGLNPACLEIEITETMLMSEVEAANQTVRKLHGLGLKLAIDDFGTGYSSLNYLKKFPIDTVKVDRSFIMDIPGSADDMAITSAVIAMAHRLNMSVVAEGVETRAQLEFLQSNECEFAQGYLFSKPVPLASIRPMLAPNVRVLHGK